MKKVSRSKIDLFVKCPRCFWLDVKHGIKQPPPAPYTINSAIDYLLKQEFDLYRKKGKPHPIIVREGIEAIPYDAPEIDKWRENFVGIQYHHKATDFLVFGAVDDIWVNPEGELIVVDYKATGANAHKIHEGYPRQMQIYQWLLRQNGHKVSDRGYFVFARVNKGGGFSLKGDKVEALLPFDIFVEPLDCNDDWIEDALLKMRSVFDSDVPPAPSETCEYCAYRKSAVIVSTPKEAVKKAASAPQLTKSTGQKGLW